MKKIKLNIQMFAVSKSTTFEETNVSIENNTSTLKITIKFSPNNDSTWFSSKTLSCTCNGVKKTANVSLSTGGSVTKTFTFDSIAHESDGSKTVAWSWTITTGTSVLGTLKDSGNKTLQVIPRASSIDSVSSGTTPYYPTIKWTPKNSTFKYKVIYSQGSRKSASPYISPNTTNQYPYSGTQIDNYFFLQTDETPVTATATLYTYDADQNPIGDPATKTFSVTLSSSVRPLITISELAEADATMQSLAWKDTNNNPLYVQNKSKLSFKATLTGVAPLATSVSATISANNQQFSLTSYTHKTFTTGVLSSSGSKTISMSATDARGITTSTSASYSVVAYSNPNITTAKAKRVNSSNVAADNGTFLNISFSGSISPVNNGSANKNNNYFKVGFREKGSSGSYTYKTLVNNDKSTYSVPNTYTNYRITDSGWSFAANKSYEVVFEATDSFTTTRQTVIIESEGDLLNFNANGRAMAIGKVSEATGTNELFEVDMPTTLYKTNQLVLGSYNAHLSNGNNTGKWMKIMHFEIMETYLDTSIVFNILARTNQWARVYVKFASADNTDPNLASINYEHSSNCILAPYIIRTTSGNWDLYVYGRAYEVIGITQLEYTERHRPKINITYPNELIDTLPSGGISASEESIGKISIDTPSSKNLFNYYDAPISVNQTRVSFFGTAGIKVSSTGTGSYNVARYKVIDLTYNKNKKVTLSADISVNNGQPRMAIGTCDANGGSLVALATVDATTNGRYSVSAITPETITDTNRYLYIGFYTSHGTASVSGNNSNYTQIQLNFGNDTAYTPYIDFEMNNYAKSKIIQMGTTSGTVFDTGISTHRLVAGIVIVLHSNDAPVIETFGRRYFDGNNQGNFTTSNANLIKENTTTRTINLTSQNTSNDRCIIFYI